MYNAMARENTLITTREISLAMPMLNHLHLLMSCLNMCVRKRQQAASNARKIIRLMNLHPELVKFRNNSLKGLDEPTKQALLEDMYDVLGIAPLRNE